MLTFLASPKPFIGHVGKIQRNAIRSWLAVHSDVEVIIYGDGEGVSEACGETRVCHVPNIPCSSSCVPYFNGIVEHASINARYDVQCYVNSDIILTPHILNAISTVTFLRYLIIGRRIDLAEGVNLHIFQNWKKELELLVDKSLATLHAPTGIDYFVFPRGLWDRLLPLVIGRAGYDGALLAFCLRHDIPIIDGTFAIPAIHQFHDYSHVAGAEKEIWRGKDASDNRNIHEIKHSSPIISDANWKIIDNGMVHVRTQINLLRRLELKLRFGYGLSYCGLIMRAFYRIIQLFGINNIESDITIKDITSKYT